MRLRSAALALNRSRKMRLRQRLWLSLTITVTLSACESDWINYDPLDFYSAPVEFDDSGANLHLNVAAVAIAPSENDKGMTLAKIKRMVARIKQEHSDVQLIAFGELILQAYYHSQPRNEYVARMAEPIPGVATETVRALALEYDVAIAFGLAEVSEHKYYNTQVLITRGGQLVRYRKRNLIDEDRENGFLPGNDGTYPEVEGFRTAMLICSDVQSVRITQEVVNNAADLVLASLSTSTGDLMEGFNPLGRQFHSWVLFANRGACSENGHRYPGYAFIIDPEGAIRARAEGDEVYAFRRIGVYR